VLLPQAWAPSPGDHLLERQRHREDKADPEGDHEDPVADVGQAAVRGREKHELPEDAGVDERRSERGRCPFVVLLVESHP